MRWRIIPIRASDAYFNMAIDQAVSESVHAKTSDPTIRFYTWTPSAVSIGCFQSMADEVNVGRCMELGVDCIRRITGGGAVYHDSEGEITYSVIAPESLLPKGIRESYKFICEWIIKGLAELKIAAEFQPINDIAVHGKKISGNAQTRRNGVVLQHGTILYRTDLNRMFSLLNISKEKISDKMIKSAEERVTSVSACCEASMEEAYNALLKGFTDGKDFYFGSFEDDEMKRAEELKSTLYSTREWNFSR